MNCDPNMSNQRPLRSPISSSSSGGAGARPNESNNDSLSPSSPSPSIDSSSSESYNIPGGRAPVLKPTAKGQNSQAYKEPKNEDQIQTLPGERRKATYKDLTYICPYSHPGAIKGELTLTNYKLFFRPNQFKDHPMILEVPLGNISRIEKVGGARSSGENAYGIDIFCKDVRSLRFALNKLEAPNPRKDIFDKLRTFSFPLTYGQSLFAMEYEERYSELNNGWSVYDPMKEYDRQGLPNDNWRITRINDDYKLCDTYPRRLAVPAGITDDQLMEVAKFRSRGRLPVLSWINPTSQVSLCRCAQPLVSMTNNRSVIDEKYIQTIMDTNAQSHKIHIMDARPKVNAMANIVNGGGYENVDNFYENAELEFLDIHNIHVMRESLRKVKEMCFPVIDEMRWQSNIEDSQWLHHLHCILKGAVKIVEKIQHDKISVVVHCSDGWDRTAQLTSLAMLFLDPYYRTLKGFEVLLEKEWLSFGHKFSSRIGHGEDKHNDNDRSPVFLQFIDCVWQILNQFPNSFEFNEDFLMLVLDHLYSCLFGTFLFNSDKERKDRKIREKSQSLWSFVNQKRDIFHNPMYNPSIGTQVLFPEVSTKYMKLWTGYYCRWNPRMRPQESTKTRQTQLLSIKEQFRSKVDNLRQELEMKRKGNHMHFNHDHGPDNNGSSNGANDVTLTQFQSINI